MTTVAWLDSFVNSLIKRAGCRPAQESVVRTLLRGIAITGSVVLSEVLRPQVRKEDLHAAEQRVSQALKNDTALDTLPDVYLDRVAETASSLRFRTVDGSDLSKPAGRAFEYLDVVRDGSCKPRDRVVVGPNGVQPSTPPSPAASSQARNKPKGEPSRKAKSKAAPSAPEARRPRTVARAKARKDSKAERVKFPSPPAIKKLGYWTVQKEAGDLIQAYLERWGSEEVTRACKQLTGLERIRVRSFHAMRRLLWLAMIAVGMQSLMILTRPRLRRAILDRAKELIPKVRFVVYRIWRVVQADLRRALEVRPHRVT